MTAYYNEFDPFAAQWLRNLIAAGHIASGDVDERSIEEVTPADTKGYAQCHFFAGIGAWSYALRNAGWPDDRPVWTGSCPCQPFSTAGKGAGFADERHLWPAFHHLIRHVQPPVVFGEQVASKDGRTWLSLVHTDLEALGYSFGAADLCAAGVGAPHIRQRLYWVAEPDQRQRRQGWTRPGEEGKPHAESPGRGAIGKLAHLHHARLEGRGIDTLECADERLAGPRGVAGPLVYAASQRSGGGAQDGSRLAAEVLGQGREAACQLADAEQQGVRREPGSIHRSEAGAGDREHLHHPFAGGWSDCDWLPCRDGKARPVEPGTFPLAHGAPSRVGRLRAYGNAIVPQVAEQMIRAYMECRP